MANSLLSGRRVLVVEDEMLILMAIEDLLGDLGCTSITAAATIDAALEMIASHKFDLATLDVNLNGVRSDPIARALSNLGVPFALSTGYGDHGLDAAQGRPVLRKQYTGSQFHDVMCELLAAVSPRESVA